MIRFWTLSEDDLSLLAQVYECIDDYLPCLCLRQVKVWFQNRRMKFKRQSRGHMSHDGRSNVDSSPRRSADDDDDDDDEDECLDERRRVHGTSTVTSRSGSPAVDSTTTDYCSLVAGDARTPADRSNEPLLLSSQQTSLDNDKTHARCSDKALRPNVGGHDEHQRVVDVADQPPADPSADDANRKSDTAPQTTVDAVNVAGVMPSETQNNLARLEIMTCIAGGNVDRRQSTAGLEMDSTLRSRRGHAGAAARSSRPAGSRCDGRRTRAGHSRTRNGALMAACSNSDRAAFDVSALSNYRRVSVFDGDSVDKNYVSDFRRECRDTARDLVSRLAFPGSMYSDTAHCLYSDLTDNGSFSLDSYPNNSVSSAFQQQRQPSQSFGVPTDSHFQSTVVGTPSSPSAMHSVRTDISFPHPLIHSAASFPVCDAGWQTWKDWRWNNCASFPANAVDYDEDNVQMSGEYANWRPAVDTRGWTSGGHDAENDVIRTSFPPNQVMDATRRSQFAAYWSDDCSTGYPCTSSYVVPYYDGSGRAGSTSSRPANCCSMLDMPPTASSRFYDGECCYVPASSSLSTVAAADEQELTPCQSAYQSCKYSRVVDGQCRLYSADDSGCQPPTFVNTA